MPAPDNKIDELLKAFAKRRRLEGDSFDLDELTRGNLQDEVARQFSGDPNLKTKRWASVFGQFWPRFAMSATLLALLIVGSFFVNETGNKKDKQLASQETAQLEHEKELAQTNGPALAPSHESLALNTPNISVFKRKDG